MTQYGKGRKELHHTFGEIALGKLFFIAEKSQSRTMGQGDFAGEGVAEFGEEALCNLVLGVGVDAQLCDATLERDVLGLLHEGCCDATAGELRVHGDAVHDDGELRDVPAYLCVAGLLICSDGSHAGYSAVDFSHPELAELYVLLEDLGVRVDVIPLEVAGSAHEGNDASYNLHNVWDVILGGWSYLHRL